MNTLTNARKTKSVPANSCDGLVKRIQANRTRYLRVFHHNIVLLHFLLRHCTRPVHFHVPGLSLQTDNIVQRRARRVCEVLNKRRRSDEIIAEEDDKGKVKSMVQEYEYPSMPITPSNLLVLMMMMLM